MTDQPTPPPTAHAAVTRGLERALRDLGVDLVGCPPSVLSGHVIKELREAGLRIGEVVALLLRGGTTDTDRRRSALAALTRPADDVCGHGIPRALVDCEKCETTGKANADA